MEIREINKLGKDLELYTNADYVGKGFPLFLPRGAKLDKILKDFVNDLEAKAGYENVKTPCASRSEIYKIEDRFDTDRKQMFIIRDVDVDEQTEKTEENQIALKPYSSPFHCAIYNSASHTYKELPIKYSERAVVFRNEDDIKGIRTTRQFTSCDNSIFTTIEELEEQIKELIEMQLEITEKLGIDVEYTVNTWNTTKKEEYIGTIDEWDLVTNTMKKVLDNLDIKYGVTNKAKMYGPSIMTYYNRQKMQNLQVDFEITHRFDTKYITAENEEKFPYYIHSNLIGSYERMISILIEKYEGKFPFWLMPDQVIIIDDINDISDKTYELEKALLECGIRVKIDKSSFNNKMKLEKAQNKYIPYIICINKDKLQDDFVVVYHNNQTKDVKINELIEEVKKCQKF